MSQCCSRGKSPPAMRPDDQHAHSSIIPAARSEVKLASQRNALMRTGREYLITLQGAVGWHAPIQMVRAVSRDPEQPPFNA